MIWNLTFYSDEEITLKWNNDTPEQLERAHREHVLFGYELSYEDMSEYISGKKPAEIKLHLLRSIS